MPTWLETPRLRLRTWQPSDRAPYAAMNADPEVRRYFPTILSAKESDEEIERIMSVYQEHGFCFFAAELTQTGELAGFIGLSVPRWQIPFKWSHAPLPCVEIGWRLARHHWGKGLATEGAKATLECAFTKLQLPEIVALTLPANMPSRNVMDKLGMKRDPADDFAHPRLAPEHPMSRHVLYRSLNSLRRS
jgi:ribosomal-protein-alanine N-acetyltransferase